MTDKDIQRVVGKNIKRARMRANFTQECLAELIGSHATTVAFIEAGKYTFTLNRFVRLVQCLKTSANRLIEGVPTEDPKRLARIAKALARKRRPKRRPQHWD